VNTQKPVRDRSNERGQQNLSPNTGTGTHVFAGHTCPGQVVKPVPAPSVPTCPRPLPSIEGTGVGRAVRNNETEHPMSPLRVIGIDPSLTATGLATITNGQAHTHTITSTGKKTDTLTDRDTRLAHIVEEITSNLGWCDLVVIEGPAIARNTGSTWDRAGLWWRIVHRLHGRDIPVAICPPTVRAKWAAGRGNADKAAVAVAVARLWPAVELDDDNQADALALATIGAQHVGATTITLQRHRDALNSVAWPSHTQEPTP
jgi:crossover junction endodeoxyribonuclease RuvC